MACVDTLSWGPKEFNLFNGLTSAARRETFRILQLLKMKDWKFFAIAS